ncbi:MAG: helix-turn-helix domain-containing protein [Armatimonadetes bacterium]|nr:helix-turn-helix domain-containing protein [Armatimonadota bacterium]
MRSLQDWTRYLEEQEQEIETPARTAERRVEERPEPPAPVRQAETASAVIAAPEVEDDVPAFLRVESEPVILEPEKTARPAELTAPTPVPAARPRSVAVASAPNAAAGRAARIRKRLPTNLDAESVGRREVAERSYKTFKESREELIERLVDPVLSLEEVARVLNVCPTTVRRYTNSGALAHHRTAGNQRRFRLSDVLAFLERQSGGE